jgi:tetratricopeptide (TPR) repeat protein
MQNFTIKLSLALGVCGLLTACVGTGAAKFSVVNLAAQDRSGPSIDGVSIACASGAIANTSGGNAASPEQLIERVVVTAEPESAAALTSRAWERSKVGDRETTVALFDLALLRADDNVPTARIQWSYGWAMFNLKEHACALAHFDEARKAAPDDYRWVSYTYAITYWQMGQRDVAIDWYETAAKNEPGCWIDAKAAERCTRHWLRQERRALGELLTAWKYHRLGAPLSGQ